MHEPISEVTKTSVITCILWNTARVASTATPSEIKMEPTEYTSGRTDRKMKIKRIITASMETVAIIEISRLAEVELS